MSYEDRKTARGALLVAATALVSFCLAYGLLNLGGQTPPKGLAAGIAIAASMVIPKLIGKLGSS